MAILKLKFFLFLKDNIWKGNNSLRKKKTRICLNFSKWEQLWMGHKILYLEE